MKAKECFRLVLFNLIVFVDVIVFFFSHCFKDDSAVIGLYFLQNQFATLSLQNYLHLKKVYSLILNEFFIHKQERTMAFPEIIYDGYLDIFASHISIELNKEKLMKYKVFEHVFVKKDIRTYSS